MARLVVVVDNMVDNMDVRCVMQSLSVLLEHPLTVFVELGDEMHGGGVLVSRWPQRFTVVGVGIAMRALLLAVGGWGAIRHGDEWHCVTKE